MNEQAILDSYNLFVQNGYNKSLDDYKKLIASNPEALQDSYNLFVGQGYNKSVDDYKVLLGLGAQAPIEPTVKKKEDTGFPLARGLSESQKAEALTFKPQYEQPLTPINPPEAETLEVGPMGITGIRRTAEYQPAPEFTGKSVGYVLGDLLKTAGKGVVKFPADVLETAAIGSAAIKNLIAQTGAVEEADASKFAIYNAAQEYKKFLDEVAPTDQQISEGFWGQAARSLGEMLPIIMSGFVGGGAKALATTAAKKGTKLQSVVNYGKQLASRMATPQGALVISQVAAPSYEQAKMEGATENEALGYALQNALVSYPIEMLPVSNLFKRLDRAIPGNAGVEVFKRAVIGGSEEAITEGVQNIYENVSANAIYGTTKEILDGVGDASAVGGFVGFVMNGVLNALVGRRARATSAEEKEQLDKSIEEVKGKIDKINENNKKFTETIQTLDETKPRTLAYGSADYNFIERPDGTLELAQDDITKEQAEGVINNLSSTYKKIEFGIEEVEPEDPYKPTTYKVIGKPIKTEEYAVQEQAAGEVPVQPITGVSEEVAQGEPQPKPEGVTEEGITPQVTQEEVVTITTLNPTGTIFSEYTSQERDRLPLGENITTYDKTAEVSPTDKITVYRGVPNDINEIKSGDFVTTNRQLAADYAGTGKVISMEVNARDILDDITEPLGEEYILRIQQPDVTREDIRTLTEEQILPAYDEIPMNLMPTVEGVSTQDAVFDAYTKAKESGKHPEFVNTVENLFYENIQAPGVQPTAGVIQPQAITRAQQEKLAGPVRLTPKREEVKGSLERIKNAGLLRSAETGQPQITQEEIDTQMALTDAMSNVWRETTGRDDFYDTFISDVTEGDINELNQKGGTLFQNVEEPQRPISRVTLQLLEDPFFQNMKGKEVAVQSVSDYIKSKGKQIEKDIINEVLNYDKYKGLKRIPFDEFRDDVETQVMKLEKINTTTYATYGMDNLGDNEDYGKAETIIFNSPVDHGDFGHFRNDFTRGMLDDKTWEIREIPGTNQFVALDANMPAGTPPTEIAQYVGTAGPRVDVERWIQDRNNITNDTQINKGLFGHIRGWFNDNSGVYTLAELQSDYFQKNRANDLYASQIPREEVDEYINKNFRVALDKKYVDMMKDEFDLEVNIIDFPNGDKGVEVFRKPVLGTPIYTATYGADYVPAIGYTVEQVAENSGVVEATRRLATQDVIVGPDRERFSEMRTEYQKEKDALKEEENKYIQGRIEEIKKSESGASAKKQFVASQKVHELRLMREAIKHAADKGATEMRFPTPYTIAVIEGYVSDKGSAPYEVIEGDEDRLYVGDVIDYAGERMTVVDANSMSITVAPSNNVNGYDIDALREGEVTNRMDELEYDLKRQVEDYKNITREEAANYRTDEFLSEEIFTQLKQYFEENPEEETVNFNEVYDAVREYVEDYYNDMSVEDMLSWAAEIYVEGDRVYTVESRRGMERFGQPDEYKSEVDETDFEDNLSDEQSTVVNKYKELNKVIQKMRPDATVVTDDNGKKWIQTAITETDATSPIIAFQEEGGKIKGAIDFSNDNKASIYIFDGADISTLAHEATGHLGRRMLERLAQVDEGFAKDYEAAKKWTNVKDEQWTRAAEEKFARGFERYLIDGKSPSAALKRVFEKLKTWLSNIYNTIVGSSIDIELTPEIRRVFGNLLATKAEQLMTADTKDATVLERVRDFLDKAEADLDKFGRETVGINIAVPVMKAIIKTVRALVNTGITLQEAIRRAAAENNVTEDDVMATINLLAQQREQEGKPQGVSEMELPGYNRMMSELEGVIEKSRERGTTEEVAMQNAIDYLQGSRVYETASDTQREQMLRDVRKMFGKREKAAPKPEKLFGEAKAVNEITMDEYDLLKKQLKDTARGAREAIAARNKVAAALGKYLKSMVDGGYISAKQMSAIINRLNKVNMFNPSSIEKFVDYMSRVFKNASYAEQIAQVNAKLPTAKKNIRTKLGIAEGLAPNMTRLFAVDPTLIPEALFDKYVALVTMMGERKAVLQLSEIGQVTNDVNEILDALKEQESLVSELTERFNAYENKLVDEDGNVDFAGTLKDMIADGTITQQDAELMRKYKSSIVPRAERAERTEEEIEAERKELADAVRQSKINSDELPTRDERDSARELQALIKTDAVDGLDITQLNNLLKAIDNINNGFFTHYAEMMIEKLTGINNGKVIANSVVKADPLKFSKLYAKFKSLFTRKDAIQELVRRGPLYYMSQALGDFKTNNVFNALLEKLAEAEAKFTTELNKVENKLDKAMEDVSKSFKNDNNKTLMSKFKMTAYLLQLEYESNPDSKQVLPAIEFLDATIEQIESGKSSFTERDAEMLRQIKQDFTNAEGNIDADAIYKSFNGAEKKAIETIQEINNGLREKAAFTAGVIRGDNVGLLNNYVHHYAAPDVTPDADIEGISDISGYSNSRKPSTKAKSLIERTGKATPINFDIFASAHRGAKFVLMDYYLTKPVRIARKTIAEARKVLKETKKTDKQQRDIMNAIDFGLEESLTNILTDAFITTSFADDVVNFMSKQGYRALLAGIPRFAAELTSNVGFASIVAPKETAEGFKLRGIAMSPMMIDIMNNVDSKQTRRLFPKDTLSGKLVDTSIMNQIAGVRGGRAQSAVKNKLQQIYNNTLKKQLNFVEITADTLISSPDKLVMRPLWLGTFSLEFKKLTGKEPDLDKIADNDEAYVTENKEALDKAKLKADDISVLAGSTDNAFMGMLKGQKKTNISPSLRFFNVFNNFMSRFLIQEYITARTGLYAAMGNGMITRKQGVALMAGVTTRMVLYTLLLQTLTNAMVGLFVDKEDDEDEKSFMQKLGQSMASGFSSLVLGRDFGNATKTLVNYGIERMNEEYLDFLREGKYDPYKDALQFTIIPPDRKGKKIEAFDLLANMMGPFGAAAKTGELLIKKATEEPKKEKAAIQRAEKEKTIRLPLEILGNVGMIPLYKDVRKIVNAELYKDLKRGETQGPVNKISKEDMKKYFPQMYNELYGPGGTLYDVEEMKKEIRKEKDKLEKEAKDEMYRYNP